MNSTTRKSPIAYIPPPLLYAIPFLAGFFIQRLMLGAHHPPNAPSQVIGIALMLLALIPAASALLLFAYNRTTVIPHGKPSRLVTSGPYRVTRHPMYLSLTLVYLGVALWTRTWFAIPFLLVPVLLVNRYTMPAEEARLRDLFGDAYAAYCSRVRRWL